jgi:hypothetical protein
MSASAELRVCGRTTRGRASAVVFVAKYQAAFFEIVRRNLDGNAIAGQGLDSVLFHSAGRVGDQLMAILQPDTETRVGQNLDNQAFELQKFFF